MDANIILGLGLYTIIGVAPLIYNYYVVNKRHSSNRKVDDGKSSIQNKNSYNLPPAPKVNSPPSIMGGIPRTPPVIVFILNKNNLEDPEIRRLVITYLMREGEKEKTTAIVPKEASVELGVRDIAATRIEAIHTEGITAMEA